MKVVKLTKLKSALRKWPSFTKLDRTVSHSIATNEDSAAVAGKLHPVYVGKSRRRYLVRPEVMNHRLFQILVNKSNGSDGVSVACEVVMFDHLLWMLENADSDSDSMDELVQFYMN